MLGSLFFPRAQVLVWRPPCQGAGLAWAQPIFPKTQLTPQAQPWLCLFSAVPRALAVSGPRAPFPRCPRGRGGRACIQKCQPAVHPYSLLPAPRHSWLHRDRAPSSLDGIFRLLAFTGQAVWEHLFPQPAPASSGTAALETMSGSRGGGRIGAFGLHFQLLPAHRAPRAATHVPCRLVRLGDCLGAAGRLRTSPRGAAWP